jgi:photosystem II stability/assembly factor-like uncharacterized protein
MQPASKIILRSGLSVVAVVAAVVWLAGAIRAQSQGASNPLAPLHFRFIGPMGGRTAAITGVPDEPAVAYIGTSNGGIYKTTDSGTTWEPIFEHEDVGSIGALEVAPSAHNIVWAGTGEPWIIRVDPGMGDGMYKSTDEGRTWRHMGLDDTGHITGIAIDPQDADTVYVCSEGQIYRPGHERGIFKTTDGGKNWQQALFVNDTTSCSDLVMDPHDPNTLFAGMWQVIIHAWDLDSGGPSSGVYVSHDAGATWTKLAGHGLPAADHPLGRVAVNVAPTNSQRVYALLEDHPPGFYRSDDGGRTWHLVTDSYAIGGRFPYDSRFGVSSGNEDLLYFLGMAWFVSEDGGKTLVQNPRRAGGDLHNIWMDPNDPNHYMVSDDQGAALTWNGGKTYRRAVLPNAQLYHVATDNRIPYNVYGNKQDDDSLGGPSNNLQGGGGGGFGGIDEGDWRTAEACESGFLVPDPTDDNILWVTCYYGDVGRLDLRTGVSRTVSPWPDTPFGWKPADTKYRYNWVIPLTISPHDHNKVYIGTQYVMETTNAGQSWREISPDLTLNDKSHEQDSGGVTPDNVGTFSAETIFAISESPIQAGLIWVGTTDGQIQITRDGGAHWTNVTKSLPGLPPWGTVQNIEPSHFAAGTAYATVSLMQMGDYSPYVFMTTDYGQTWQNIGSGVPKSEFSFPQCVIEDPVRKGMLYLGTGNALYISWDDGGHWTPLRNNLPATTIKWLTIQKNYNDLVIATYGRGFWILDDVTPLRDWDKAQQSDAYLFKPRSAYRYRMINTGSESFGPPGRIGENPPPGGDINFYLSQPAGNVTLTIKDATGETVRTLKVSGRAGLNRVWWNLEFDPVHEVRLRTPPPDAPWVKNGPEGWRPVVSPARYTGAPRVAPGTYTVQLDANGKQLSESMTVLKDPNLPATDRTIRQAVAFSREMLGELNQTADMINQIEWDRKQLDDLESVLAARGNQAAALEGAKSLDEKLIDLEGSIYQIHSTSVSIEEGVTTPMRLYEQLSFLLRLYSTGGSSGNAAGFGPTDQDVAVNKLLQEQLAQAQQSMREIVEKDVPAFNNTLRANHLSTGIAP